MRIPLPNKGQPLDITYIYTLANAVNKLADDIAVDRFSSFGYNNALQTTAAKLGLDSGAINVAKGAADPSVVTANFQVQFADPPNVICSLRGLPTDKPWLDTVSVTNTTAGSVTFSVHFDSKNAGVRVVWIAIGLVR